MKKIICIILTIAISACALLGMTSCSNESKIADAIENTFFSDNASYTLSFVGNAISSGKDQPVNVELEINQIGSGYRVGSAVFKDSNNQQFYYESANADDSTYYTYIDGERISCTRNFDGYYREFNSAILFSSTVSFFKYICDARYTYDAGEFKEGADGSLTFTKVYPNEGKKFEDAFRSLVSRLGYYTIGSVKEGANPEDDLKHMEVQLVVKDECIKSIEISFTLEGDQFESHYKYKLTVNETGSGVNVDKPTWMEN